MRGNFAEAKIPFTIQAGSSDQSVSFALAFSVSNLIDPADSSLTALIDGLPIASVRLSELGTTEADLKWQFEAQLKEPGQHLLSIQANLNTADEHCTNRWLRETWLRIQSQSKISWESDSQTVSNPTDNANFIEQWMALSKPLTVEPQFPVEPSMGITVIDLVARLREQGVTVLPHGSTEGESIRILVGGSDSSSAIIVDALRDAPDSFGGWHYEDGTLLLFARSAESLNRVIDGIFQSDTRLQCPRFRPCLLLSRNSTKTPNQLAVSDSSNASVLKLSDVGLQNGWAPIGHGDHKLFLVWQRPKGWTIDKAPELHLELRVSGAAALDRAGSSFHIGVNEAPLISWDLDVDPNQGHMLRAKLPRQFWDADTLAISLSANLARTPQSPCAVETERDLWLTLAADSGLFIDRIERTWDGIQGFFDPANDESITIRWPSETDWPRLLLHAQLLQQFGLSSSHRLAWLESETESSTRHIELINDISASGPQHLLELPTEDSDPLIVPANAWDQTYSIAASRHGATRVLTQHSGSVLSFGDSRPNRTADQAAYLWNGENWRAFAAVPDGELSVNSDLASELSSHRSEQERKLRRINKVWAIFAGIALLLMLSYLIWGLPYRREKPNE